ncbi:MAG: DUF1844 domain-containing protein, partial [Cellulosimicrobium funkei]|uniref:DUF1844 domain-containing protein n=1 Tax=Cellulosimicrobium funkei TaxID=264251 RepID=UPI003F933F34
MSTENAAVPDPTTDAVRDIADVAAVEVITSAAVHLMSAAAVKCGLAEDAQAQGHRDLDEARKLINALAALVRRPGDDARRRADPAVRDRR